MDKSHGLVEDGLALPSPAVAIFASAADEPALEFPIDRATRFSLTVAQELRRSSEIDAVALALAIRKRLLARFGCRAAVGDLLVRGLAHRSDEAGSLAASTR